MESISRCAVNCLDVMENSGVKRSEEMNLLYSPSRWCKRMSPELVVDYHCNAALTGFNISISAFVLLT